jgi:hypothetical protein
MRIVAMICAFGAYGQIAPHADISNDAIQAGVYLPDSKTGFYRGTRFDWSGVIYRLEYKGHNYYGPWFTSTDPNVHDFIYSGSDIVAGPCSAITGPVEEFFTRGKALGYEEAKPGGTFIKIGVGVLLKPDAAEYDNYRLYKIVDPGRWKLETKNDFMRFTQEVSEPGSGYGYQYVKTVSLVRGKPEMRVEHRFKNTGKKSIESDLYNHNFLVLDKQPTGPDFQIRFPFDFTTTPLDPKMAEKRGNVFAYKKVLTDRDTVAAAFGGYSGKPANYNIAVENRKEAMGVKVSCDRPLSKLALWSIRSVIAIEPYISFEVKPGEEFAWTYVYDYYAIP